MWRSLFVYGAIILLSIGLLYLLSPNANKKKQITDTQFYEMYYSGQVEEIDIYGYTVKVRKTGGTAEAKFPNEFDAYFTAQASTINKIVETITGDNNKKLADSTNWNTDENGNKTSLKDDVKIVNANYSYEEEGFLSKIMPYVSSIVIIVIGVMLFKSMAGNNKGFGFGKSKARLVISSSVKFSDVAGADEEKQELREIVDFLKNPSKFAQLGARIPKGVLLEGNPGTGKTLLAKAVAGESQVPFFSISGSDFVELYVGVGASRVRDLFDTAKANAPCIVFIDEIDAVGRKRGAGLGGGNDEREQTLNQLLVEMDGFESNSGIIVLAATNRSDVLDPALTRPGRFDRQIYVHLPDVKGREEIIKVHAKNKPMSEDVDFKRIARLTSGLAGADIENVLNEAALLAARDDRYKITMVDIQEALNKVLMGPKKVSRVITEEDKRITAIHEAGHAIVAQSLPNCDNVQEISIIPRGAAGGYTLTFDENDRSHMTKQKILDSLAMMLGGRTAEETMLNDVTTGASNDMERATKVAKKMVTEWGMSNELGLISYGDAGEIFVGRDYQKQLEYSESTASKIDAEIKRIIEEAHHRAKEILNNKKDIIEKVVKILLDRETIYKEEFEMLYNGAEVEEVEKSIDKKEEEKREYQDKAKREALEQHRTSDLQARLKNAEALYKAGVIQKSDYEKIKHDTQKELEAIQDQLKEMDKNKTNQSPSNDDKNKK